MSTSIEQDLNHPGVAALNAAEIEGDAPAIEVVVRWGDEVLGIEHVSPPRDVRFETSERTHPIVIERDGRLLCVVAADAKAIARIGESAIDLAAMRDEGQLEAYAELAGAGLYALPVGAVVVLEQDGLEFAIRPTQAAKKPAAAAPVAWRRYATVAVSLAVHGAFLTMFYFMPPSTQALSLDNIDASSRMVQYLDDARETVDEEEIEWANSNAAGGEPGERAAGEEGAAGRDDAPVTHRRQAVRGPADNTDPHMARERLRENMAEATAIGTLASFLGSMDAPTSPFGRNEALGRDDVSAIGELMGDQMGDSFGQFGAGMRGTGVGAGGTGVGTYGVGPLGTLGVGGNGHGGRYGDGVSLGSGGHVARVPRIIGTNATVLGGLSREAIQRVVRRNMNQVRFCYEQGLSTNPSLEGRVTVGWIISPTGAVSQSSVQQDTVNPEVASCIANAVRRWSFPQPDGGGPVGVNYPFLLQTN